jgi:uncharacterized protein
MPFDLLLAACAVIAGAIASVSGFGIGSLLTPVLAPQVGTKIAVAAVSIPHLVATALRLSLLWRSIDRRVFVRFGIASASGGLLGALLHARFASTLLTLIFGLVLVGAGLLGVTGLSSRMRLGGRVAWVAGMASGALGGMVGNQGGIRSAALLGFDLSKESFVATATAAGVLVDLVRMPVYFVTEHAALARLTAEIVIASAGAVAGTLLGMRLLRRIPAARFGQVVSGVVLALGVVMLIEAARGG